jgi:hypothetical protein
MARAGKQDEYLSEEKAVFAFFLRPNTPAGGIRH